MKACIRALVATVLLIGPLVGHAIPVGIGALTGSEATETFEGLPTSATLTPWFNGWRTPVDGYVFPSGAVFKSLQPPNSNGDVIIGDELLGNVGFGTSNSGAYSNASSNPVSGSAFIADDGPGEGMSFILPTMSSLAGIFYVGTDSLLVSVYDASDVLIESALFTNPGTIAGWASNFAGIQAAGISRIAFDTTGDFWLADNLTWSPARVPEPATLALLGLGLAGLGFSRRKQ